MRKENNKTVHLIYIFQNRLANRTADVHQSLQMASAFAEYIDVTFLTTRISNKNLQALKKEYQLSDKVNFVTLPVQLYSGKIFAEYYSRIVYNAIVYFYLLLKANCFVYSRDISFILFLSKLPSWLRIKSKIYFEPHKVYHKASVKVSKSSEEKAIRIPDFFFPITEGVKSELVDIFSVDEKYMKVMPSGYNKAFFDEVDEDREAFYKHFPLARGKKVIVYAGSFLHWKGIETLIEAACLVNLEKVHFLLIGGESKNRTLYKAKVETLGISDRVELKGKMPISDIINVLKCSDIGVIPNNHSEMSAYTSPLKVFEYLGAGLPIVASSLLGIQAVLDNEKHALFFEPENAQNLSDMIVRLVEDPVLRSNMRQNNQKHACQYDWKERARMILETIKK